MPVVAPDRAPYEVFVGGRVFFAGFADSLCALRSLLHELQIQRRERFRALQAERQRALLEGQPLRPLPPYPFFLVFDRWGQLCPDLDSAGKIDRAFSSIKHAVSYGWDGDIRPRGEPVPGTGRRFRYSRTYLRNPSTSQARRQAYFIKEEGEPEIRGRRRAHRLPSLWDDQPKTRERCWKQHRRTQWR